MVRMVQYSQPLQGRLMGLLSSGGGHETGGRGGAVDWIIGSLSPSPILSLLICKEYVFRALSICRSPSISLTCLSTSHSLTNHAMHYSLFISLDSYGEREMEIGLEW